MKAILFVLMTALPLAAQVVLPTTGKKFVTRDINGNGANNSVSISGTTKPAPPPKAKLTSFFSFSETRQWKSNDGKSLLGSLICYEEAVLEIDATNVAAAREAAQKAPPAKMPDKPTLVRDGKVRLLVNNKPFEVPLDRLSDDDRKFAEDLIARVPK